MRSFPPINGQVLDKNLTLGEMVETSTAVYRVADMETVWVEISLLQKHLPFLKERMAIFVKSASSEQGAEGTLAYMGPLVGRETRTAMGRAVLPNPDGRWRPGLFVSVEVDARHEHLPVVVPKGAVQKIDDKTMVFVPEEKYFVARAVTTGQSDGNHVEITSGLSKGEAYVSSGAFELKAALITDSLGSHAGHGH
jgi:cobalt-zinc-cadmium efflux system membrane fusion protein